MQYELTINGTDFSPWLEEEGITQTEEVRQNSEIIALNGVLWRTEIVKVTLSVSLVELRDETWKKLLDALQDRPVTVTYTDNLQGRKTARFWPSAPSATARTVRGGITFYSGVSFELTER